MAIVLLFMLATNWRRLWGLGSDPLLGRVPQCRYPNADSTGHFNLMSPTVQQPDLIDCTTTHKSLLCDVFFPGNKTRVILSFKVIDMSICLGLCKFYVFLVFEN